MAAGTMKYPKFVGWFKVGPQQKQVIVMKPSTCKGYNPRKKKTHMYFRPLIRTQPFITGADLGTWKHEFWGSFWGDIGFYRQVFVFFVSLKEQNVENLQLAMSGFMIIYIPLCKGILWIAYYIEGLNIFLKSWYVFVMLFCWWGNHIYPNTQCVVYLPTFSIKLPKCR